MLMMIERGDRIPGLPLASRIADAYDLDYVTRHHLLRRSHWLTDPNRDPHELDYDDGEDDLTDPAPAPVGPVVHWGAAGRMVDTETSTAPAAHAPVPRVSPAAAILERMVEL